MQNVQITALRFWGLWKQRLRQVENDPKRGEFTATRDGNITFGKGYAGCSMDIRYSFPEHHKLNVEKIFHATTR